VRDWHREGRSQRAIARDLHIDRDARFGPGHTGQLANAIPRFASS
jgi:hypothetical protein